MLNSSFVSIIISKICEQSFDTECETLEEEECNTIYEEVCEPVYKVRKYLMSLVNNRKIP